MGAIVTFDYAAWETRFPEFVSVLQATAQAYFNEATMLWKNDGSGPVNDPARQSMLLNLLTAHIAKLAQMASASPGGAGTLVGPITSASEGSVSVGTSMSFATTSAYKLWLSQTQYGLEFLAATIFVRSARYRPRKTFIPSGGPFPGGPGRW